MTGSGAFPGEMRTRRIRRGRWRLGRRAADRLLGGEQTVAGFTRVANVLSAAAAPARPEELSGEEAAVAAFVAARRESLTHTVPPRRRPVFVTSLLTKAVAAKLAVGLAAGMSFGGVAVAAEQGSLPEPAQDAMSKVLGFAGVPNADAARAEKETADAAAAGQGGEKAGTPGEHGQGDGPEATGPTAFAGLCRAYAAGEKETHGEALESTAFQALSSAAGGEEKVGDYCAALLSGAGKTTAPGTPAGSGKPTPLPTPSHPAGRPTSGPAAEQDKQHSKPAELPTQVPVPAQSHSTGVPAVTPPALPTQAGEHGNPVRP